jgi:triacylglycerol lipase
MFSGSSEFNAEDAYQAAKLCELSYLSELGIKSRVGSYKKFKFISVNETQCFVVATENNISIVFRGSQTAEDWSVDFDIELHNTQLWDEIVGVHQGFLTESLNVFPTLVQVLSKFNMANKPVYVMGHSLGAALAGVSTILLESAGIHTAATYCFGMPRIGDNSFSRIYDTHVGDHVFRIVNQNDVVTRVPFRSLGYAHVGQLVYIEDDYTLNHRPGVWHMVLQRFNLGDEGIFALLKDGVDDHDIKHYVEAMFKNTEVRIA